MGSLDALPGASWCGGAGDISSGGDDGAAAAGTVVTTTAVRWVAVDFYQVLTNIPLESGLITIIKAIPAKNISRTLLMTMLCCLD